MGILDVALHIDQRMGDFVGVLATTNFAGQVCFLDGALNRFFFVSGFDRHRDADHGKEMDREIALRGGRNSHDALLLVGTVNGQGSGQFVGVQALSRFLHRHRSNLARRGNTGIARRPHQSLRRT